MIGKLISFWDSLFSGAMLVLGSVSLFWFCLLVRVCAVYDDVICCCCCWMTVFCTVVCVCRVNFMSIYSNHSHMCICATFSSCILCFFIHWWYNFPFTQCACTESFGFCLASGSIHSECWITGCSSAAATNCLKSELFYHAPTSITAW